MRTPQFKAWFGDWEAVHLRARLASSPEHAVTASGLTADGSASNKMLRDEAVRAYIGPPVVTNSDTGQEVRIERSGLENSLQHGMRIEKRAVVRVLDALLQDGVLVARDTSDMRQGVRAIETFAARVSVDGRPYIARAVVREVADGRRFYDHELSSLESARPASTSGGSGGASTARQSEPRPLASLGRILVAATASVNHATVSKAIDPFTGDRVRMLRLPPVPCSGPSMRTIS